MESKLQALVYIFPPTIAGKRGHMSVKQKPGPGLEPSRSGERIFFSLVNFLCTLRAPLSGTLLQGRMSYTSAWSLLSVLTFQVFWYPFHPRVCVCVCECSTLAYKPLCMPTRLSVTICLCLLQGQIYPKDTASSRQNASHLPTMRRSVCSLLWTVIVQE